MNLKEFRQRYPQYSDMTDQQLADSFHRKFYADMPKADFYSRIGYKAGAEDATLTSAPQGLMEQAADIGKGAWEAYRDWYKRGGITQYLEPIMPGISTYEPTMEERLMGFAGPGAIGRVGPALTTARGAAGPVSAMPKRPGLMADFARAGVDPNIPALAQNRGISTAANVIHDIPWAGNPIAQGMQKGVGQAARTAERLAGQRGAAVTRESAGAAVQRGLRRFQERDFAGTFGQKADDLFQAIPIKPDRMISISNTAKGLKGPMDRFPTAPALGRALTHPKLTQWREILEDAGDNLTWGELREFRTRVGDLVRDFGARGDIPEGDLKQLYGAITNDLKAAATAQGDDALKAFNRANQYYSSGMKRLEGALDDLTGAKTAEAAYAKLESAMMEKGAASKLRAVKRSLKPDEWGEVVAMRIRDMGKPTPGAANVVEGVEWSPSTFVTQYQRMSKPARDVMFSGPGLGEWKQAMDSLVKVASAQKEVGRLANPSGSGRFANLALLTGAGVWAPMETALTTVGARIAGEAMMSPRFIRAATKFMRQAQRGVDGTDEFLKRLAIITEGQEELTPVLESFRDQLAGSPMPVQQPIGP